jgi:peroxiredoxin
LETGLVVSSAFLWVVVLSNLLLTLALVRRLNKGSRSTPAIGLKSGQQAPDFSAHTLNNETVTRSTFVGRKAAFIFISTQCDPCREFMPSLTSLENDAAQAGVELILVSSDEQEETRAFAEELNISLPVLVAPRKTNSFFEDYKATLTPSYCFINEQGLVQSAGLTGLVGGNWQKLTNSWTQHTISVA